MERPVNVWLTSFCKFDWFSDSTANYEIFLACLRFNKLDIYLTFDIKPLTAIICVYHPESHRIQTLTMIFLDFSFEN